MTERHLDDDDLVALALQEIEPEQRARLSEHLAVCASCRDEYGEVEDAVSLALAAAPSIAPPAGFSGEVLGAMEAQDSGPPAKWWRRRTALIAAAAALVIGLGAGISGTLAVQSDPLPQAGPASGAIHAASALMTGAGDTVGVVGATALSGREYLVITVTQGRAGVPYECVIVGQDGERRSAGSWTLDAAYGKNVSGSWVVEQPPGGLAEVELVAPSGNVWARADF